ncbi:MAG TPA: NAD(P)/FAD-dependent oxidoreductase [Streptosporangiaceae bacterium]|nr:NAD(P)/FAD-dependent oxidoreductase [Streptosporangiaceae bacterium]
MAAFDVVVLGGGTAGVHVATEVAGGGKTVALVEAGLIGGESAYLACLPSNSLLLSASRGEPWEDAVARRVEVTGGLDDSAAAQRLNRAGVQVIRGTGRITAPGTVEVTRAQGAPAPAAGGTGSGTTTLTYSDLVIATGCEPVAPPIEGLSDIPAWTTAQSLSSPDLPRRLIVLGGGPAGCELTQMYASFGSQVTLVEAEPRLLPGEPAFAGEMLAVALRRAGAEIRLGSRATKAERTADGLTLALEDGTRIDADRLLLASGRRPRLGGLGLDVLGLEVTPGMALPTTTRCEVAGTGGRVWAAGDVTGTTHTHASHYQADVVAANILGRHREADYSAIPRCVFTTPSVFAVGAIPGEAEETAGASDGDGADADHSPGADHGPGADQSPGNGGRTRRMLRIARAPSAEATSVEAAAAEAAEASPVTQGGTAAQSGTAAQDGGPRLVTARARLGDTARGYLGQDDLGRLELYADAGTGVLAGAVAVGPDAASWMSEVTLAIRAKIPVAVLADVVHAFPTYGEALETALRELAGTGGSTARADQQEKRTGTLSELDIETPEDDAIEQHQEVIADEAVASPRREVPFDVNEADAAEQERAVGFDDDDYR